MSKLVQIPESNLEALLREAGRTESVESYLRSAEVQATLAQGNRLLKRAGAAYWSRYWLLFSAVLTWGCFLFSPDLEGFISGVLLTGMTVVEYKVHALFLAADVRGSIYGWWNQCLFAVLFLIYGGYHGMFPAVPPDLSELADQSMVVIPIVSLVRIFYYTVAIVGSIGQFSLACYYRAARR
ncbi:MAG TPA: hypothetical protein VL981_07195 [Candidatus Methylacidiphilales bacterium]|nr:hypothetical protein [Candidatus Methylacidiphilales bacterium]